MKNKQKIAVIGLLFIVLVSGLMFVGNNLTPKIKGFFKSQEKSLSSKVDSSFRQLSDIEQIKILREIGKKEGSVAVYETLLRIYPDEPADEHELGHVIGETAFLEKDYAGFEYCNSFMRYSCYHGVVLEAIKQKGYDQQVLLDLGKGCLELPKNKTTITACVHGVGHALMVVSSYNLLASYQDCDKIFTDPLDLFFCYDGVSMENVVRRQLQPGADNFIDSKNPYYPCDSIPEKYQPACVREHLHHARRVFYEMDTLKTQNYCLYFKNPLSRIECFGALGGALNQDFSDKPEIVISECGKVTPEYKENCFGTAAIQYSFGRQFDKAVMVCNALGEPQKISNCMGIIESVRASLD